MKTSVAVRPWILVLVPPAQGQGGFIVHISEAGLPSPKEEMSDPIPTEINLPVMFRNHFAVDYLADIESPNSTTDSGLEITSGEHRIKFDKDD